MAPKLQDARAERRPMFARDRPSVPPLFRTLRPRLALDDALEGGQSTDLVLVEGGSFGGVASLATGDEVLLRGRWMSDSDISIKLEQIGSEPVLRLWV